MVRGLYTAYTGMVNQQKRMDVITNNLANASTVGYKREGATSKSFEEVMTTKVKDTSTAYITQDIGKMSLGVRIGENYTDYSQGSFKDTENTYDLALAGNGFFAISFCNKAGEESVKYTRDGSFTVDIDGALRTKDGDYVLSEEGEQIYIPTDAVRVVVDDDGTIFADSQVVAKIGVVDFEDYNYLKKYGENMVEAVDGAVQKEPAARVKQGYLEMSNINVVNEMVEMITITRTYESNQKAIQTVDSMLEQSANSIGKV